MQVQSGSGIQSVGVQTPLLHQEQLMAGVIITGMAMSHLWEVKEIDREGRVIIQKLPTATPIEHHRHHWTAVGRGEGCECGMRREGMREFLPVTAGKARVYLISAKEGSIIQQPQVMSVYMGMVGGVAKTYTMKPLPAVVGEIRAIMGWSEPLPFYPMLHKVWEVPEELRQYVRGGVSLESIED